MASDGYVGVYQVDGGDFNGLNYWWMCVEPTGTPAAYLGESFIADAMTFADGWTQQNSERFEYYNVTNPGALTTVVPKQVAVMSYVLDTYLPWDTMAGASGRFAEQDSDAASYGNNETFYNSLFAVQHFLAETYGTEAQTDFTDLSNFADRWELDPDAAAIARSALFQSILDDVETKDGTNYFDTYDALHGYYIASTSVPEDDPNNWQDALIIYSLAPVPEPSGVVLAGCAGLLFLMRRSRRTAASAVVA